MDHFAIEETEDETLWKPMEEIFTILQLKPYLEPSFDQLV